jgi:hypothetical protein
MAVMETSRDMSDGMSLEICESVGATCTNVSRTGGRKGQSTESDEARSGNNQCNNVWARG